MPDKGFHVTVDDLETGEKKTMHVHAGDYMLIPFAPCRVNSKTVYPKSGTVQLTIKDHRPQGPAEVVAPVAVADEQPDYWREQAERWARRHFLDIETTEDLLDLIESIVAGGQHA